MCEDDENTGRSAAGAENLRNAEDKGTAELISNHHLEKRRKQRKEERKDGGELHYFPKAYRNAQMELLAAYRKHHNTIALKNETRNLGWLRIARQILEADPYTDSFSEADVKSLKNALEAHRRGTATINEDIFPKVERYIRTIDLGGLLDEARRDLANARRAYHRSAFQEMFRSGTDSADADMVGQLLHERCFIAHYEDHGGETWSTIIKFAWPRAGLVLDVEVFQFIGNFWDFVDTGNVTGATFYRGFVVLQEVTSSEEPREDSENARHSATGVMIVSQPFDVGLDANGLSAAWLEFRTVRDAEMQPLDGYTKDEIALFSLPLPHHRIFYELLCDTASEFEQDPISQQFEVHDRIGLEATHHEQIYSLIEESPELSFIKKLSEKFDGAY